MDCTLLNEFQLNLQMQMFYFIISTNLKSSYKALYFSNLIQSLLILPAHPPNMLENFWHRLQRMSRDFLRASSDLKIRLPHILKMF